MKINQCVNRMIEVNSHVGGIYVCLCFNFKLLEQLFIISINISK